MAEWRHGTTESLPSKNRRDRGHKATADRKHRCEATHFARLDAIANAVAADRPSPLPYFSWLDSTSAPIGVQQKLMRHAQVSTTMNVYGNALMTAKREANSKVVKMALRSA